MDRYQKGLMVLMRETHMVTLTVLVSFGIGSGESDVDDNGDGFSDPSLFMRYLAQELLTKQCMRN